MEERREVVTITDVEPEIPLSVGGVLLSSRKAVVFLDRGDSFDEVGMVKQRVWEEVLPLLVEAVEANLLSARLTPMEVHAFAEGHGASGEVGLLVTVMDKSALIAEEWDTPFNLRFWFSNFDELFRAPSSPLRPPGIMGRQGR